MAEITGFVGYECEDIIIYLAEILNLLGKKIAIVDRTEQEILLELAGVERQLELGQMVSGEEFHDIWITSQGVRYEEFDVVFLVFGYRMAHPKLYECDNLVLITDGFPAHASLLRKINKCDRKKCLLIRNLVDMKYGERYLAMLSGQTEIPCFMIPYEEQDMRMRYYLGSDSSFDIRKLSKRMKEVLRELLCFIAPEYGSTDSRILMKKIERVERWGK